MNLKTGVVVAAILMGGCSGASPSDNYDGSVGRTVRQEQTEMYNAQQLNEATGKSMNVPLH